MRARKKKNTVPRLEKCGEYFVGKITPADGRKICLEIGCGKGKFIASLAEKHREADFYAIEKVPDVMVMAAEKCLEKKLENLHFLLCDAKTLSEVCPEGSVDTLYLNFSDPWPKKKHENRRLTHRIFLEEYRKILKKGGRIKMKTDNEKLFDFSLEEFSACGFVLTDVTRDLHNSDVENEFMTEYETRFSEQGMKIFHLQATVG